MKKRNRRRKKKRTIPVPIASMGDIAFLLIIFFLVCSESVKENANIEATMPNSEHVKPLEVEIAARVAIDQDGVIYFDGRQVESAQDIELEVRLALVDAESDAQRHVQFKCDAALTKDTFEPVMKAIVQEGGILQLIGEEEPE